MSRDLQNYGANIVCQRLRDRHHDVLAVNPDAAVFEGDPGHANLASIPGGVDAVVIASAPNRARSTAEKRVELDLGHADLGQSIMRPLLQLAGTVSRKV